MSFTPLRQRCSASNNILPSIHGNVAVLILCADNLLIFAKKTELKMNNPIKVTVNTIHDIAPEKRFLIDELTIVGQFELKRDLPILRSMCNTIVDGKRTGGNLSVVDLSKSYIAAEFSYYVSNPYSWGNMEDSISLKKISLPSKIELYGSLGTSFSGCKSLESIFIVGNEFPEYYKTCGRGYDIQGVLFLEKGSQNILLKYPANKGNEYTIPDNVNEIGECAFEDCHLSRLTMPKVPPTCKENAFKGINMVALTLVVPKGSHDSYWLHPVFGKFRIEEKE